MVPQLAAPATLVMVRRRSVHEAPTAAEGAAASANGALPAWLRHLADLAAVACTLSLVVAPSRWW